MTGTAGNCRLTAEVTFDLPPGGAVIACHPGRVELEGVVRRPGEVVVFGLAELLVLYSVAGVDGEPAYRVKCVPRLLRGVVPAAADGECGDTVALAVTGVVTDVTSEGQSWLVSACFDVAVELPASPASVATEREKEDLVIRPFAAAGAEGAGGSEADALEAAEAVRPESGVLPDETRIVEELKEFEAYLGKLPKGRMVISINGINYIIESARD
ncbi:hypothetical protein EDD75_0098 [Thermodesulfitimonas autotrophica]|uniref:Uncharacterized protein n=1 Tax=Thermodesulfitimonas autotrophica TaxID=1894989 RepID=A0A3N5AWN6_9THEO|nr:hypothetical protein [Thermodesulfitimonas autotrophica]RPF49293.1 hypothetical protein EDD75_0098 [Thermodesulfitimonas autotrophica]